MKRISQNINSIKESYDVVVVGSGYGGSITASRLSRAGKKVCVLERGREILPGDYPNSEFKALKELQIHSHQDHFGSKTGLFDLHVNDEQTVIVGCGLGGTSLINANVALQPESRVFDDRSWPSPVRDDDDGLLKSGFDRAIARLKPSPYPDTAPSLRKLEAHKKSAAALAPSKAFYRPPLNITFTTPENGINHVGVAQSACNNCGDCVSGCNYSAKNTTLMNYLPDAHNFGTEIFCSISVLYILKKAQTYTIYYQINDDEAKNYIHSIKADLVMIAAGTLGSTEILLRSQQQGLPLSKQLGQHFSGNGDMIGFAYNCDESINGIGRHDDPANRNHTVGPCISSIIDLRDAENRRNRMVIQEGTIPSALSSLMPMALAVAAGLIGEDTDSGKLDKITEGSRVAESLLRGAYYGAIHNLQTYLIMSHDDAKGTMRLNDDKLQIQWPKLGQQQNFKKGDQHLKQATQALGGTYIKNPTWNKYLNNSLVTVHPLGGCVLADSSKKGVCNHKGQVFTGSDDDEVYSGLYVSDGAIIPCSLAVNPLLTISALTERCCELIARDRGWIIDYILPTQSDNHTPESNNT